ncbi:MAG: autotransporter-associated beta strand repeat-containing protein, partial [Verrucomicrobiota bacterium]|nr:autotransporter-associated beta strand repeat-containing protein [Verrucomicrobiota bacterium]
MNTRLFMRLKSLLKNPRLNCNGRNRRRPLAVGCLVLGIGLGALAQTGHAQGVLVETWAGVGLSTGSYGSGTVSGVLGLWSYTQTRWGASINGDAICVRAAGVLTSPTLSGGCSKVSFSYNFPYSESGSFNMALRINGEVVQTLNILANSGATVMTATFDAFVPVSGDVVISFTNMATSNKRIAMDDITITGVASGVAPVWAEIAPVTTTVEDGVAETMTDYLTTLGTPPPTISVEASGSSPTGDFEMDGNDFYFFPDPADVGKTFTFRFTAANASGAPTQTMTVSIQNDCTPDAVVLVQQAANYDAVWGSGGGSYNNSSGELGMWANQGDKQTAAWRKFRTTGTIDGALRELQVGDRFRISVRGYSSYGGLGVSLNDGAATGNWANRFSNTRASIQTVNFGDLYVTSQNGDSSWSGIRPWNTTLTMEFTIQSSREFTANIMGQTAKVDLPMQGAPGDDDRFDGFSIFYADDWNGTANSDLFWTQETSVTNLGVVEFGADGGSRSILGRVSDGSSPACPDTASPNNVIKKGAGTITLSHAANTYSGGTDIQAGTLSVGTDGALGMVPTAPSANIRFTGTGAFSPSATLSLHANRGISLGTEAGPQLAVSGGRTLTVPGEISGSAAWTKTGAGTLVLSGANTFTGAFSIGGGIVRAAHALAFGGTLGGSVSVSGGATLALATTNVPVKALSMAAESTLEAAAGQSVTLATAGSIANVSFDAAADGAFTGGVDKEWALVTGAGTASLAPGARLMVNAPVGAAAGAFALEVRGGGVYVVYRAAPVVTVETSTAMSISFAMEPCGTNQTVLVRYDSLAARNAAVAASGRTPVQVAADSGGILVYAGTGGAVTDNGLDACSTYYYRAWSWNAAAYSSATVDLQAQSQDISAPVLGAVANGSTEFTFSWLAVPGASAYQVDVATAASFAGPTPGTAGILTNWPNAAAMGSSGDGWIYVDGAVFNSTYHRLTANTQPGCVSPVLSTRGYSQITAGFDVATYGGSAQNTLILAYSIDGGPWVSFATNKSASSTTYVANQTAILPAAALEQDHVRIKWYAQTATSGVGLRLQNLKISGTSLASDGTHVPGYSNLTVTASTSCTVTGLTVGATYYYRVRALGGGGCVSEFSPTGSVTTLLQAPEWTPIPDQVAVVGETKTVALAASGSPAPTYAFISALPALSGTPEIQGDVWSYTPAAADAGKTVTVTLEAANDGGGVQTTFLLTIQQAP